MADTSEQQQDWTALDLVFSTLPPSDLARCLAVSRLWRGVAARSEVHRAVFASRWQAAGVLGAPRSKALWLTATVHNFAWKHRLQKGDTLSSIAVRFGSSVASIRRANNLMSDHSLHSRAAIYVPVPTEQMIQGQHIVFEYCNDAKREWALAMSTAEAALRESTKAAAEAAAARARKDQQVMAAKLCALMGKSLHVDEATARFYLAEAGGDLKQAIVLCRQALRWDCSSRYPHRHRGVVLREVLG